MSEILPFILCPVLESFKIKVVLLWLKPKGGGKECPVVKLENVPPAYDSVLTACNFVKLKTSPSWIVDVSDKDELFWKRIFGDIQYVKKKPESVYQPDRLVYAALPAPLIGIIREYTEEHIQHLTKSDLVTGIEAIRQCKRNCLEGSIISRGVWRVVRAAALDRISNNPEDIEVLEYIHANGKSYNLDVTGFPANIDPVLLLKKIVERKRLTAQMEKVLPLWYRKPGAAPSIIFTDWTRRIAFIGSEFGGPVDEKQFSEVEALASYLIDSNPQQLSSEDIEKHSKSGRFTSNDDDIVDWVSHLEIPNIPSLVPDEADSVNTIGEKYEDSQLSKSNDDEISLSTLQFLERLNDLSKLIDRRVDYSKTISRLIFTHLVFQPIPCENYGVFIRDIELLISKFSAVTNVEILERVFNKDGENIINLIDKCASSQRSKTALSILFYSHESLDKFIQLSLCNGHLVGNYWWEQGFAYSRAVGTAGWRIFKINSTSSSQLDDRSYESLPDARAILRNHVIRSRISTFRRSFTDATEYVAYKTSGGQILVLSENNEFESKDDWVNHVVSNLSALSLSSLKIISKQLITKEFVLAAFKKVSAAIIGSPAYFDFGGRLEVLDDGRSVSALWHGKSIGYVRSGNVALIWIEALLRFSEECGCFADFNEVTRLLTIKPAMVDWELGFEDEIIDSINDLKNELDGEYGINVSTALIGAMTNQSMDSESICYSLLSEFTILKSPPEHISLVRDVLLFTANHRPYEKMTTAYSEALRLGLNTRELLIIAFARYVWIRLTWNSCYDANVICIGDQGDIPHGELLPEEDLQWTIFQKLETAVDGIRMSLTSHAQERTQ
jgi:hypothetical protein